MSKLKLTIDLGSTEFKAAVYNDLRLLGSGAYKLSYQRDGVKVELPVDAVLKAFIETISKTIKSSGISIDDIGAIGVTSQAQTFALMTQNDNFITPFISWLDMRAVETCKTIVLENFAEHSSLAELQPNMQICILKHLFDENPEIAREKIKIIPLPTYLIMLLTGRCVSDNNIAAMSGLFSLQKDNYWQSALGLLNINRNNLPKVIKIGNIAGQTINDNPFGIPVDIPVFSCGNDQTAGAFGAGLQVNDILITLGTAQTVYRCCNNMPKYVQFRGHYPNGLYYSMFAGTGGDLITKAIEKVPEFKDFKTFAEFAANADKNIDAGFYFKSESNEIFWTNDRAGLAEKALSVLNFLANETFGFFIKLNGNIKNIKIIYIAGGGQKNSAWVSKVKEKFKYQIKHIKASPTHGVARMIDDITSRQSH